MGIVEFLTARLDEREQRARQAEHAVGTKYDPLALSARETVSIPLMELYREAQPARVLAEVKANRRTLARHSGDGHLCIKDIVGYSVQAWYDDEPCPELRDLAAPDDQHPDYNPAWAVS